MKTEGVGFYSRVGLYWSGYGIKPLNLKNSYGITKKARKMGFSRVNFKTLYHSHEMVSWQYVSIFTMIYFTIRTSHSYV